jgi:hypothetical protein
VQLRQRAVRSHGFGKADIFDQWFDGSSAEGNSAGALVVVSLGTSQDSHELSPDEIAGALVGQVERLVIDGYRREHPSPPAAATGRGLDSHLAAMPVLVADGERSAETSSPDNVTDIRALLEGIKKSQPLAPAGPSKNGVHLEPDSASYAPPREAAPHADCPPDQPVAHSRVLSVATCRSIASVESPAVPPAFESVAWSRDLQRQATRTLHSRTHAYSLRRQTIGRDPKRSEVSGTPRSETAGTRSLMRKNPQPDTTKI